MEASTRLWQRIKDDPLVTIYCGARVYVGSAPHSDDFPRVVVYGIDEVPQNTLDGWSRLSQHRFQVDCMARGRADAMSVARAAVDAAIGSNEYAFRVLFYGTREEFDDEARVHRVSVDFTAWAIHDPTSE